MNFQAVWVEAPSLFASMWEKSSMNSPLSPGLTQIQVVKLVATVNRKWSSLTWGPETTASSLFPLPRIYGWRAPMLLQTRLALCSCIFIELWADIADEEWVGWVRWWNKVTSNLYHCSITLAQPANACPVWQSCPAALSLLNLNLAKTLAALCQVLSSQILGVINQNSYRISPKPTVILGLFCTPLICRGNKPSLKCIITDHSLLKFYLEHVTHWLTCYHTQPTMPNANSLFICITIDVNWVILVLILPS